MMLQRICQCVLVLGALTFSCVGPPEERDTEESRGAATAAVAPQAGSQVQRGLQELKVGDCVEVEGQLENGERFVAEEVERVEEDADVQIGGPLEAVDAAAGLVRVLGIELEATDETSLQTHEDEPIELRELRPGEWVKVTGRPEAGRIRLKRLRTQPPRRRLELEGPIEAISDPAEPDPWLQVVGWKVWLQPHKTQVEWEEPEEPDPLLDLIAPVRVTQLSEEKRRRFALRLGDRVAVGGQLEATFEGEQNYNLDNADEEDEGTIETVVGVDVLADLGGDIGALVSGRFRRDFVVYDEEEDNDFGEEYRLAEAYLFGKDLIAEGVSLQLGRQDVFEPREWLFDERLDAIRLYGAFGRWDLEAFTGGRLFLDQPPRLEDKLFTYFGASYGITDEVGVGGYLLDVRDHFEEDGLKRRDSPLFLGLRSAGEPVRGLGYWAEAAYVTGVDDTAHISGYGFDVGGTYVVEDVAARPYFTLGFAHGSGDGQTGDKTDHRFRQTGLQDNNSKFGGVTSFRYYGELVDPELSNLNILTAGVGLRPTRRSSIDLVYHHYVQDVADRLIRPTTGLKTNTEGDRRFLGEEWDLILGWRELSALDVELIGAVFEPGTAFSSQADTAYFIKLQFRYRF